MSEKARKCPKCGSSEWYELASDGAMLGVCANCRALLRNTPFRVEFVDEDASERFPEILNWWNKREEEC